MTYKRLIIRHYIKNGVKTELKLPFATITSPNLSHVINTSKYRSGTEYKNNIIKQINRSYPITISGVIQDDRSSLDINGDLPVEDYKTLEQYIEAINSLEPIVNFSFYPRSGTILITGIDIDSYGIVRNYKIEGTCLC